MDIFAFINITAFLYAGFNRVNFISLTRVFCVSFLFSLHLHYKHIHVYVNIKLNYFFWMLIFLKSFLFLKRAFKRLFKRLFVVFASGLIRYGYRTYKINMYGRFDRPFFRVVCFSSRKTSSTLERMERVHVIQYMLELSYIRTRAHVLLIQSWSCYERTLSTMYVEKCFNTIINIWMSYDWSRERCGAVVAAYVWFLTLKAPWAWIR